MAYLPNTYLHFTFDSTPLLEQVETTVPEINGVTVLDDAVFEKGILLKNSFYIETLPSSSLSNEMTIGFWLKSNNPGVIINPDTLEAKALKMPVLAKANFSVTDEVIASTYSFIIWEETQLNNKNVLKIKIKGTTGVSTNYAELTSGEYDTNVFNHFWIAYQGATATLKLFINTEEDIFSTTSGTVPENLSSNSAKISVNKNAIGKNYEIGKSNGILDDLIILNSYEVDADKILSAANNGAIFIADDRYSGIYEISQAIIYDDPGTAQINCVYTNKDNVYIARSDGKILKGTKLLWQNRTAFSNKNEYKLLNIIDKNGGYSVISSGSLNVYGQVIRV